MTLRKDGDFSNLFMLKEAFHSEKMEGVIPESMTLEEYIVRLMSMQKDTEPRNEDS